jgi:hypothetical protein
LSQPGGEIAAGHQALNLMIVVVVVAAAECVKRERERRMALGDLEMKFPALNQPTLSTLLASFLPLVKSLVGHVLGRLALVPGAAGERWTVGDKRF